MLMKKYSWLWGLLVAWTCHYYVVRPLRLMNPNVSRVRRTIRLSAANLVTPDDEDSATPRLNKARLRLAEAQGIIPIGASDLGISLSEFKKLPKKSKVREISWRVAEPEVPYDPVAASSKLLSQPFRWLARNIQIFVPITAFAATVLFDIATNREEQMRTQRAKALLDIISSQSPALIKAGQALSSRSDLLPKEYLDALQQLQDRVPPFANDDAIALFESELGVPFNEVFDVTSINPIAAASIGQVYKATLRRNGAQVAIKIQRPNVEEAIAVDLFVMRWYAEQVQNILARLDRNIDLVSVIDDFGEIIYREIDYRAEAVNAQRFAELYANIPDVFVPKIYTELSTSKVLTMEWVDGARLTDSEALRRMGLESSKLVDILVQCTLRQMLENGFFHADPHAGNLLAMPSGKLCYLDFGMVSYVEPAQRYSIIEAVVHLVNRDFYSLAELYRDMGFIPTDVDTAPIIVALEDALPDVLNAPVAELNFKNVIGKLGDIMYRFPFSLPPFYISIIRCLGVLEGIALQIDKDFRIISDAYPYIASRLLTDPSNELQSALQKLVLKDGQLRWDRLEELLEEASATSDYDITMAIDQMVTYLSSEQGRPVREVVAVQMVEVFDQLESETVELLVQFANSGLVFSSIATQLRRGASAESFSKLTDSVLTAIEASTKPSSSLLAFGKVLRLLRTSEEVNFDKISTLSRKVLREPVFQQLLGKVISQLSERISVKMVRRLFGRSAASYLSTAMSSALSAEPPSSAERLTGRRKPT